MIAVYEPATGASLNENAPVSLSIEKFLKSVPGISTSSYLNFSPDFASESTVCSLPISKLLLPSVMVSIDSFISVGALFFAESVTFVGSLKSIEPEPGVAFSAIAAFFT